VRLIEYANVPRTIGSVVSRGLASMHELDTVLGTEDLFDLVEIISVDCHNQNLLNKRET
jgi:hypothetical protein